MTSMNPAVLAIAGPIGSGKTTTATLLAQRLGWPQDGYGDTIRAIATPRPACQPQHPPAPRRGADRRRLGHLHPPGP